MSTLDDRSFRKMISALLRDLAAKVDRGEVVSTAFSTLAVDLCPPGHAVHTITFQVRRSS